MIPRNAPYEHSPPRRENIVTVVMPGITSTRSQISRYTGGDPVTVLCNWSDVDPTDPLHLADVDKNRFKKMSLALRFRRACHYWRRVVMVWKRSRSDTDDDDDADRAEARALCRIVSDPVTATDNETHTTATRTLSLNSDTCCLLPTLKTTATASAVKATELGFIDPPLLYRATCRIAPRLLHGVLPSPEVAEVRHRGWYLTPNPLHWLLTVKTLLTSWWFNERPYQWCYSEPGRTNIAGLRDQAAFIREVRRAIHHINDAPAAGVHSGRTSTKESMSASTGITKKHVVLFGVSRGATTCFYAAMKLPKEEAKHVSLVLVEAPFDTLDHVIAASCWAPRLVRWFVQSFSDWRGSEEEKIAYDFKPEEVHLRCPVAFVVSLKDNRVPMECTQALIDRVRRELVPHVIPAVEVLVLQHSRHPGMAVSNKEDQDAYVAFVERLYDTYCSH